MVYGKVIGEKTLHVMQGRMNQSTIFLVEMNTLIEAYYNRLVFEKRLFEEGLKNLGLRNSDRIPSEMDHQKMLAHLASLKQYMGSKKEVTRSEITTSNIRESLKRMSVINIT